MNVLFSLLTGGAVPPLLLGSGVFFLVWLRGRPLTRPRGMLRALTEKRPGGVSPFRALTQALAGTLGVGNVVGVANAIAIGGAGAIFFMWVSALLAMILKYAEILLAVRHRETLPDGSHTGGAALYLRAAFPRRHRAGAVPAVLFAALMVLNALTMGCVIQVNAIADVFRGVQGVPVWVTAAVLVVLAVPVIPRGSRAVSALTEYLVPIMSLGYVILAGAVLFLRREALPSAFAAIFREAFTARGAVGGAVGFLTSRALRVGTMRGLLSNEAGCGTAPTAHACANTSSPAAQGVWGIFEVFVDTILLCTLTALVILVNGEVAAPYAASPVMMTAAAFSATLGRGAAWFLSVAVLCFGYATVVCWADYGAANLRFLGRRGERFKNVYYAVFAVCIPLGCTLAPGAVWAVSDIAMTALTAINLFGMVRLRKEVREETDRRFGLFQPKKGEQRNSRHGQDQARTPGQEPAEQAAQTVQTERDAAKARGMVQ